MSEKEEFIELPDMEDGDCYCEAITTDRIAPFAPVTIGNWCVCEFKPKRGKKRKLKVKIMGIRKKEGIYK